jgi:hypothetical protein
VPVVAGAQVEVRLEDCIIQWPTAGDTLPWVAGMHRARMVLLAGISLAGGCLSGRDCPEPPPAGSPSDLKTPPGGGDRFELGAPLDCGDRRTILPVTGRGPRRFSADGPDAGCGASPPCGPTRHELLTRVASRLAEQRALAWVAVLDCPRLPTARRPYLHIDDWRLGDPAVAIAGAVLSDESLGETIEIVVEPPVTSCAVSSAQRISNE